MTVALGYALPLGLALTCAKAVEAVLFVLAIGLWLVHGD
ncbi:hypothetical protein ABIC27_005155 [Streptomyces sp. PvR034]